MGVVTIGELKPSISGRRSLRPSSSVRHHANEWPISDVSSDLTIDVGKKSFPLHKFPLISRCGRIRKLLLHHDSSSSKLPARIALHDIPGGPDSLELAAKFCYGINIDINPTNIAMLRCMAHYLEMTEELSEKNLEFRAETYLKDAILPNITTSISVLHQCETLRPVSEEINLVSRLINAIANNVCKEQLTSGLSKLDHNAFSSVVEEPEPETTAGWWGKSLAVLKLDFFQRVVTAVKSRGLKQDTVTKILINYAQESIHGLGVRDPHSARTLLDPEIQRKQRVTVEAIVGLLPTRSRKSSVPMVFLSSLLKTAIAVSASASCRSDLERRIGLQLEQAILEDILIPGPQGNFQSSSTLYDTDSVLRIYSIFMNLDDDDDDDEDNNNLTDHMNFGIDSPGSPKQTSILKVSKLLDSYLAEVALDSNLLPSKFITLAELLPDHARVAIDGLYQAVDLFLKVHPNIKETDRYRLCKTINCQKLSQEACSHAAQNERLPVQMAVQVLYFEQIRMKNAMSNGGGAHHNPIFFQGGQFPPQRSGSGAISPRDNYASVRRENRELKLEVARMRMRLTDLEKDHVSIKQEIIGRPGPANKLLRSFTVKLRKINALFRVRRSRSSNSRPNLASKPSSDNGFLCHKRRNHSIS